MQIIFIKWVFTLKFKTGNIMYFRMIGEMDYDSLFFDNSGEDGDHTLGLLPYKTVTLFFFIGFMMIVPIIIMNLLVMLFHLHSLLSFTFGLLHYRQT